MNRRQFLQFMGIAVAVPVVGPAVDIAQRGFSAGGLASGPTEPANPIADGMDGFTLTYAHTPFFRILRSTVRI